jgi:hypothetical protein
MKSRMMRQLGLAVLLAIIASTGAGRAQTPNAPGASSPAPDAQATKIRDLEQRVKELEATSATLKPRTRRRSSNRRPPASAGRRASADLAGAVGWYCSACLFWPAIALPFRTSCATASRSGPRGPTLRK